VAVSEAASTPPDPKHEREIDSSVSLRRQWNEREVRNFERMMTSSDLLEDKGFALRWRRACSDAPWYTALRKPIHYIAGRSHAGSHAGVLELK